VDTLYALPWEMGCSERWRGEELATGREGQLHYFYRKGNIMWLLNVDTVRLKWFTGPDEVPYAILSHTWGQDEVTFQDMQQTDRAELEKKAGLRKFEFTRGKAKVDELEWVWIDTCCIDKSSSAELQEAINSMLRWYHGSTVCYALLDDLDIYDLSRCDSVEDGRWLRLGRGTVTECGTQ
jgi:hypothetical protein